MLATLSFASPAFGTPTDAGETPQFVANPVQGATTGTFGFARATTADGTVVADFSAGPGSGDQAGRSVPLPTARRCVWCPSSSIRRGLAERPDYYDTHPRAGYPLHKAL